jgi:hypothetical protein
VIDHLRKLLFIHVARTGGTSIESALVEQDWWVIEPWTKHISARQARERYGESYTTFSVVRNPWERVVSMWATKWWHQVSNLGDDCTFEVFIKSLKPHPCERYNSLHYHEILNEKLDFVLRFEKLQQDFDNMLSSVGIGNIPLRHLERREHEHYRSIYGERERHLIAASFAKDISTFGYDF